MTNTLGVKAPPALAACGLGDVIAVRTSGKAAWWIRFGAALRNEPNLDNHIVIVYRVDETGTVWGLEGRPGGVGEVDCAKYFTGSYSAYAVNNRKQYKTAAQREAIVDTCYAMLGTKYDWPAIAADALVDLRLPSVWADRETWGPQVPVHVVCSSLAAWAYWKNGLYGPYAHPTSGIKGGVLKELPLIQPADWVKWMIENNYASYPDS
jgi:hypothetical protein